MIGMIAQLLAWPTLGVALLVFGFAPGIVLRLIVLLYRRDNPRRQELLGEIYAVPRIERPFWVAEQLEVALFEGLRDRIKTRKVAKSKAAQEATVSNRTTVPRNPMVAFLIAGVATASGIMSLIAGIMKASPTSPYGMATIVAASVAGTAAFVYAFRRGWRRWPNRAWQASPPGDANGEGA